MVDDNPADRVLVQVAFELISPAAVLTCVESASAALDLLRNHGVRPDVMLLDLDMPYMDGFQLLGEVKQDARLAQIQVVVLTGYGHKEHVERAYALQASSYLVKSLDFDRFVEQLERLVRDRQVNGVLQDVGSHGEA
nr:response regulator [Deinococcus humi]